MARPAARAVPSGSVPRGPPKFLLFFFLFPLPFFLFFFCQEHTVQWRGARCRTPPGAWLRCPPAPKALAPEIAFGGTLRCDFGWRRPALGSFENGGGFREAPASSRGLMVACWTPTIRRTVGLERCAEEAPERGLRTSFAQSERSSLRSRLHPRYSSNAVRSSRRMELASDPKAGARVPGDSLPRGVTLGVMS
jgi:hypothetical protein